MKGGIALAEKQSQRDRIKEITNGIEQGIKDMFNSDNFRQYLKTMSRFHRYSLNNIILIQQQCPDATHVAGFTKWKNEFGRNVRKGEKGIRILAPAPVKKKIEMKKIDPDTKTPVKDEHGNDVTEEKEVKIPYFKVVSVFDVSQTDGRPLPAIVSTLDGRVEKYDIFLEALKRSSPVPIDFKDLAPNLDGYFHLKDQAITLRSGMSEVQTVCAAVHEIAHAKLHNYAKQAVVDEEGVVTEEPEQKGRRTEEVEAESVAYSVCQYFHIETADNSFGYIAGWSQGKELKELRESLETINRTASELITDMEHHIGEICKERGIDLTPEVESLLSDQDLESLYLIDDSIFLHVQKVDEGWDYSLFDKNTKTLVDGGHLKDVVIAESPIPRPIAAARTEIMELHGIEPEKVIFWDLSYMEELRAAQDQLTAENVAAFVGEVQEQAIEVPPDPTITVYHMESFGFKDPDMLPVSHDRAIELAERGIPVYSLHSDGSSLRMDDPAQAEVSGGLYGITKEDWERVRLDVPSRDLERRFMERPGDMMAIYQLKETAPFELRFESLSRLDNPPAWENYDCVYIKPFNGAFPNKSFLEQQFSVFNMGIPDDFTGHSMSVSDIVALRRGNEVSYHYCDSFGFRELHSFHKPENYLKAAEMAVEDDYGMIDGVINNGRAEASQPKKASVIDRLKSQPSQSHKSAPKKTKEREI